MKTEKFIQMLAQTASPARPLPHPWIRTATWLAIAIPYIALVVYAMSPRADLAAKLSEWRYIVELSAAFATGIAAAAAAFATTIPGYDRRVFLLPFVPLAAWIGVLGQGCVSEWIRSGPEGLTFWPDWFCLPATALVGALPAIVIAVMLRRGAPLFPHVSVFGGLAAAGLGNFGLRFFHPQDASLMVLVWQFGSVFALAAFAGCAGRYVLNWRSVIGNSQRRSAFK
jgi:hypothetical protein